MFESRTYQEQCGPMPVHRIKNPVRLPGAPQRLALMTASAGFPSPAADDLEEEIDPISWVVRHPTSTFWWRAYYTTLLILVGISNQGETAAIGSDLSSFRI